MQCNANKHNNDVMSLAAVRRQDLPELGSCQCRVCLVHNSEIGGKLCRCNLPPNIIDCRRRNGRISRMFCGYFVRYESVPNIVKNIFIVCGFRDQPVSKRLVLGVDLKRTESESQSFRARSSLFSKERMLSCMVSFLIFLVVNSFDSINVTRCMRDCINSVCGKYWGWTICPPGWEETIMKNVSRYQC